MLLASADQGLGGHCGLDPSGKYTAIQCMAIGKETKHEINSLSIKNNYINYILFSKKHIMRTAECLLGDGLSSGQVEILAYYPRCIWVGHSLVDGQSLPLSA